MRPPTRASSRAFSPASPSRTDTAATRGRSSRACLELFLAARSGRTRRHSERMHVKVEDRLLFLPLGRLFLPKPDHLPHHLGVEAVPLRFGEDVADVVR